MGVLRLAAINQNQLLVKDDYGEDINPRKYVTTQTLSPNDSVIVTSEDLNNITKQLCNQYNSFFSAKEHRPNFTFEQAFSPTSQQAKVLLKIANSANKDKEELTENDIYNYYPIEDGLQKTDIFYQNFSSLFKRYNDKLDNNEYNQYRNEKKQGEYAYLTTSEFTELYGEAPWKLVNEILNHANLDYYINSPENLDRNAPFELKLVNNLNKCEIKFGDLSSGEKVLMSLALALYNASFDIEFPKLLLMDEPDASLHPSMSKKFLDVIQQVFVNQKKVKVIMTTHSASTVALAPEESIFLVNKTGIRVEKVTKDRALKILTSGVPSFSVNYENRRQVFVESPYDVIYYEKLYNKLSNHLNPEISLTFISSGDSRTDENGSKIANCGQVINITETLRKAGNRFIFGIIDRDLNNKSTDSVKVLGEGNRYNIESYIFDPLLLAALLLREKLINKKELNLEENETYTDFKHFKSDKLQIIANYIISKVEVIVKPNVKEQVRVILVNEIELSLPKWYLDYQGHKLEEIILKIYPQLNSIKKGKQDAALKVEILNKVVDDIPDILSIDILNIFKSIQDN